MAPARRASKRPRSTHPAFVTSSRAPRRCHVCPGLPLKSICACSMRHGIAHNREDECAAGLTGSTILPTASAVMNAYPPPFTNIIQPTTQDTAEACNANLSHLEACSANPLHLQHSLENIREEAGRDVEPVDALSKDLDRSLTQAGLNDEIPIDPALLVVEQSPDPPPIATPEATSIENDDDEALVQPLKVKRLKASERSMKYGLVDGVMRGNMAYRISRQNERRRPISDASSATTRYNQELPSIISRAERLALETDAYILILAQQATSSSASVHFASERMRRDALDQRGDLVNNFQSLMTQLAIAKRSTALALAQNLEVSEKARAEAEEKLLERDNAVASAEAELAASNSANQALLAELEALRNSLSCSPQRPT